MVLLINKHTLDFLIKKLIFFWTKETMISLFLVEHYAIETVIIRHYLFPYSIETNQKYKYESVQR